MVAKQFVDNISERFCAHFYQHLNGFSYFYLIWIILLAINHLFVHNFQVLLCIAYNSIKLQSFVYRQLNDQTVQFQTIQSRMSTKLDTSKYYYVSLTIQLNSHLFTQLHDEIVLFPTIQFSWKVKFKLQTVLFDPKIGPYQVQPLRAWVDLEAMARKTNSAFDKVPTLQEPYRQIV